MGKFNYREEKKTLRFPFLQYLNKHLEDRAIRESKIKEVCNSLEISKPLAKINYEDTGSVEISKGSLEVAFSYRKLPARILEDVKSRLTLRILELDNCRILKSLKIKDKKTGQIIDIGREWGL
jgi:hypothetical protein